MKGVLKVGRNQKRMTLTTITMSLLLCTGCQPFNHGLSSEEMAEDSQTAVKLLQPISIESVDSNEQVQQSMTRQIVDYTPELKVGVVNDIHQDLNCELLQKTSEQLNANYPNIEFESQTPQENNANSYLNTVNQLIANGARIVLIPNQSYEKELETIITNYPDIMFLTFDYYTKSNNVLGIKFREESAAYLAGVIAAAQTKTNKVAYLGYSDDPSMEENYVAGFIAGAKMVNPTIEVTEKYVSKTITSSELRQIVRGLYEEKHDIILEGVGSLQYDVIGVAKEYSKANAPVYVINSIIDLVEEGRLSSGESVVLTSTLKNVDVAISNIFEAILKGEFNLGSQLILGLENNGVGITLSNSQLTDETLELVRSYKEKIISGEIVVPISNESK